MKKIILSAFFALVSCYSFAQDDVYSSKKTDKSKATGDEYSASNGVTYKIGDTIRLGRGSDPQGNFRYLELGGWGAMMSYNAKAGPQQNNIGRGYNGTGVTLKKIRRGKIKGIEKVYFVVGGGNITNYNMDIEAAISSCEVVPCKDAIDVVIKNAPDKESELDKLKKLKELLDAGAITQQEYDEQKKKILEKI